MTSANPPLIFSGKPEENAQDFLRSFRRELRDSDDTAKTEAFRDFLRTNSDADEWYAGLPDATKNDWALLQAAFHVQYPATARVEKTTAEYERELMEKVLTEKDLGTKVEKAGEEKWSHVAWAEDILRIARQAGVATSKQYISLVRQKLPELLKQKLATSYKNWTAFTAAVRAIDPDFIAEGSARLKRDAEMHRQLKARIEQLERAQAAAPASPTAPLRARLARATINSNNAPLPAQPNFVRAPLVRTEPLSPERRAVLMTNVNKLPHHPATPEGLAAYKQQLLDWVRAHGLQTTVAESTPVPLTPGTADAGAGECFNCGQVGHNGANRGCPSFGTPQQLPRKETDWRRIVFINRRANRPPRRRSMSRTTIPSLSPPRNWRNREKGRGRLLRAHTVDPRFQPARY